MCYKLSHSPWYKNSVRSGRGLPADLVAIARKQDNVEIAGFVEDLTAVYRRAAVVLLPVVEGAGMLFKALEALAMGKAAVGFKQSFRGIPQSPGTYLIVDSAEEMARETVNLLKNALRLLAMTRAAREFALNELSWEKGAAALANGSILCRQLAGCGRVGENGC